MPVSSVRFGNKIYGNVCHWINCFSLASNFLMITNCFACTRNSSILFSEFTGLQLQPETGSLGLPVLAERGSWLFASGSGYTEGG